MDLHAIRCDLATVYRKTLGFNAFEYVLSDTVIFPAMVAGLPDDLVRIAKSRWQVTLPVTMLFSLADDGDAQARLDTALSAGNAGAVYDALNATDIATVLGHAPAWESLRWLRGGNAREVTVGESRAFAFDIDLELIA